MGKVSVAVYIDAKGLLLLMSSNSR